MEETMTQEIPKMELTSLNVQEDQLAKLKAVFPEVFNEDKVDWDKLRRTLGEIIDTGDERYGMNWPGKGNCFRAIQESSVGALKPCKEESINWDSTENLFIEGDNLEVLKLLQQAYYGKVKMIYIDPPYNTGSDFIYPDNYTESLDTYLKYTNQIDSEGRKYSTNAETDGRFHSKWMNMVYPRLFLAKNLLKDDGFIVISIDDTELKNLLSILDEVFGEENKLAVLVWDRNRKNDAKYFSVGHEYMVIYAKDQTYLQANQTKLRQPKEGIEDAKKLFNDLRKKHGEDWVAIKEGWIKWFENIPVSDPRRRMMRYTKVGLRGPYRDDGNIVWPGGNGPRYEILHPTTGKPCRVPPGGWRFPSPERFWEEYNKGRIIFGKDEATTPGIASFLFEGDGEVMPSVFYSYAQVSAQEFQNLMGERVFDNPKNWKDIQKLISYLTNESDIILDFFAGSGTTAHACLELNYSTNSKRKFILVQLPEVCDEKSPAFKAGYKIIPDIAKDRIRKVIDSINAKNPALAPLRDLGVRVFKLSQSNFKIWGSQLPEDENVARQIEIFIDHINPDSTDDDILFEILSKAGYELTTKVETIELAGKKIYSIAGDVLLICLERQLTKEVITAMALRQPARVVCLDAGFDGNDQLKTNAVQIMKSHGVTDFKTV
jgi:adenine-specific DNA-methyltransferase